MLKEIANLDTPQILFAWHRKLVAKKYDASESRLGRPRTKVDVAGLVVEFAKGFRELFGNSGGDRFYCRGEVQT
jgi:hypothetical protein